MPNYPDPSPLGDSLSQWRTATVTPADLPLSSPPHNTSIALTRAPQLTLGCTALFKGGSHTLLVCLKYKKTKAAVEEEVLRSFRNTQVKVLHLQ